MLVLILTIGTKWYKRGTDTAELDLNIVSAITKAIKAGFRHIDGAQVYKTEPEIGEAIRQAGVPRADLFITTKQGADFEDPAGKLVESLQKLGTDYVDLYLIHKPFNAPIEQMWPSYEKLLKSGKTKAIGVSNFRQGDLEALFKIANIKPAVNQIEYHPSLQEQSPGIVKFCQDNDIVVSAYGPLGPVVKSSPPELLYFLDELASKYKKTPNQIIFRWHLQTGVVPITTSSNEQRIKDALAVYDFEITDEEVKTISTLGAKSHVRRFFSDEQFA